MTFTPSKTVVSETPHSAFRIPQSGTGFTLIELIVVIAIIGVLTATVMPLVTGVLYKARVASTAASLRSLKDALDMLVTTIGVKPGVSDGFNTLTLDRMGLLRRSSVPTAYQALWTGPYLKAYPNSRTAPLFAYSDTFWYLREWPGFSATATEIDWCGTELGVLMHTQFVDSQAKIDVENVLIGRTNPFGNNWLYYCGFHDSRQVPPW